MFFQVGDLDAMVSLYTFTQKKDSHILSWARWIREDPQSHWSVALHPPKGPSKLVQLHLIDAHLRKVWMPYFRRDGHPVPFLNFVGVHLPQAQMLDLSPITVEELNEVATAKQSSAGGLDGWLGMKSRRLSLSWFVGLAHVLRCWKSGGLAGWSP